MKRQLNRVFKILAYSFLLFTCSRIFFLAWNFRRIQESSIIEVINSLFQSSTLDLSTACYILAPAIIFMVCGQIINERVFNLVNKYYLIIVTLIYIIIAVADSVLYSEWGGKLDYRALSHLTQPDEVFATAGTNKIVIVLGTIIFFFLGFYRVIKEMIKVESEIIKESRTRKAISVLLLITLLIPIFIGIRGGIKPIPISQSDAFYTTNSTLNNAAVNPAWNLLHSVIQNSKEGLVNPYNVTEPEKAWKLVEQIKPDGATQIILDNTKPDIVFMILESWSVDFIGSCGGDPFTEEFDKLCKEGFLFSNTIASGLRSDQGMASIFAGFPAQPNTSITKQPGKTAKLPSIINKLNAEQYESSFVFGGQLRYANLKSFLVQAGFQNIIEESDIDNNYPKSKLGIPDEFMFPYYAEYLKGLKSPFVSTLFTVSTHSPYDMPYWEMRKITDYENQYVNSAIYTDIQLGKFFNEIKNDKKFSNTLFVILADHSHNSHKKWDMNSPEYHKIPMLLYGEPLKKEFRGKSFDHVCSQTDVGSTLLAQMGIENEEFKWSRDLLNSNYIPSAYYAIPDGFGWVKNEGSFTYIYQHGIFNNSLPDSLLLTELPLGQAYLQCLFDEYLSY